MKTQLIQDFDESGSAPAAPAALAAAPPPAAPPRPVAAPPRAAEALERNAEPITRPRPAVWRRPQQVRAPAPAQGFAPQPPDFASAGGQTTVPDLAAPLNAGLARSQRDTTDVNGDSEWLATLLARDAEELSAAQASRRRTRRLAAWGAAGVALAVLAAGGLWLYQDNRVEGALVVVASTSPAPAAAPAPAPAAAARPSLTGASAALSTSSGVAPARVPAMPLTPTAPASTDKPAPVAPLTVEKESAAPSYAEPEKHARAAQTVPAPRPRHTQVRKHPKPEATAGIPADTEASSRQRREETLMQCRAHGYDERQCLQRGCEMTRFGFACKG